ncbi:tRNA preQ1(34) S-adenosylmethionine ribosyltransferase-isomerase QueA [bacterium E08(2017)]|nr:tRNA preQ1(34) S-adenosylmethionine ribosyltransferase-isomerase QueA [bacterium E08(2017)]
MKTSEYDYDLPEELIAQEPPEKRGTSRMMVVDRSSGAIEHRLISDIPEYLRQDDVLVVNNTKVINARVFGTRQDTGGRVELLLVEEVTPPISNFEFQVSTWDCFLKASNRPPVGAVFELGEGRLIARVKEVLGQRIVVEFESGQPLLDLLEEVGVPPVPPYIRRDYGPRTTDHGADKRVALDHERYQTVYAKHAGSVAAPTAGLHFTEELLGELAAMGVCQAEVTLNVGPGTFKPVEVDTVEEHAMEAEWSRVSQEAADSVNKAKEGFGRVVAVGSTSVRTLESACQGGKVVAGEKRTSLFIYPPYEFQVVDMFLTNFHLPKSSLIMMVSAFAGKDLTFKAYEEAVREGYRFYSYGDAMLIV